MKVTTRTLKEMKSVGKKITMLTAYDQPTAKLLDEAGLDIVLIGDSVGDNVLGYENTLPVTMDDMLHHSKAVSRGVVNAMIVSDMPFMSYQIEPEEALYNASRFIKEANVDAVKLEGVNHLNAVTKIIEAGIPVMGHIGFTPQSVNQLGGYKVQGKTAFEAKAIIDDAKKLEKAGVFAIVLEMVPADIGEKVSKAVEIPVIGCGAGPECDGQVLVVNDILGLSESSPKFAKKFADLRAQAKIAVQNYIADVKGKRFPDKDHSF